MALSRLRTSLSVAAGPAAVESSEARVQAALCPGHDQPDASGFRLNDAITSNNAVVETMASKHGVKNNRFDTTPLVDALASRQVPNAGKPGATALLERIRELL